MLQFPWYASSHHLFRIINKGQILACACFACASWGPRASLRSLSPAQNKISWSAFLMPGSSSSVFQGILGRYSPDLHVTHCSFLGGRTENKLFQGSAEELPNELLPRGLRRPRAKRCPGTTIILDGRYVARLEEAEIERRGGSRQSSQECVSRQYES